jgi:hypothetical protein
MHAATSRDRIEKTKLIGASTWIHANRVLPQGESIPIIVGIRLLGLQSLQTRHTALGGQQLGNANPQRARDGRMREREHQRQEIAKQVERTFHVEQQCEEG